MSKPENIDHWYTDTERFPHAPAFFRRVWPTGMPGEEPIVIFGFSMRSPYPEDHRVEDNAWINNQSFPSYCFSEVEPRGEYGFTPGAAAADITEEDFVAAHERGWLDG